MDCKDGGVKTEFGYHGPVRSLIAGTTMFGEKILMTAVLGDPVLCRPAYAQGLTPRAWMQEGAWPGSGRP
jgi:hypothetical protein